MARKNRVAKHTPYHFTNNEAGKTRYATKQEAEQAAEYQMLLKPELNLRAYKAIDGGWYLTRQQK